MTEEKKQIGNIVNHCGKSKEANASDLHGMYT